MERNSVSLDDSGMLHALMMPYYKVDILPGALQRLVSSINLCHIKTIIVARLDVDDNDRLLLVIGFHLVLLSFGSGTSCLSSLVE